MKIAVETKAAAAKDAEEKAQMKTVGFLECFVSLDPTMGVLFITILTT